MREEEMKDVEEGPENDDVEMEGDPEDKETDGMVFALHPEDHEPSGTCNFSRIDNTRLFLQLDKEESKSEK